MGPYPLTKLNTPFGTPASCIISASNIEQYGDISLGLRTIVHPLAIAADTFVVIWFIGQFHGVIIPITPIASFLMVYPPSSFSNSNSSRASRVSLKFINPVFACALSDNHCGAPISLVITSARSLYLFSYSLIIFFRRSILSFFDDFENDIKASEAASTAELISSLVPAVI